MAAATRLVTITNRKGLHARPAAKFVKTAEQYNAQVSVRRLDVEDGDETQAPVGGTSILGIMMLAAEPGAKLELSADGEEAEAALAALTDLIERKFDEDE